MMGIDWRFFKFCLKLSIRFMPRFHVAFVMGALRAVWETMDKFHAEITAYCDAERRAQQEVGPPRQAKNS